jgi:dihydrofolate reductase
MTLSIIAAMAQDRVIGRDNQLPWRLPADLKRFKQLTMGHTLLMGRKTYESIGRPLPGRTTVVVSRQAGYAPEGVIVAASVDEAIARAPGEQVFVAGGAEIYRQTLARADRLYLTLIDAPFAGDTWFPAWDPADWQEVAREAHADPFPHAFVDLVRRG